MRSFGSYRRVKIADVAEVNPRRPAQLLDLSPAHSVTFVPMAAVDEVSGRIIKPEVKRYDEVRKGFTYFGENDVLFAKITPCMQNGKSAIARNLCNGLGFGSTEFHVLRPSHEVLPEWLWYFVRQESLRSEAQRYFKGSAGQQRVPADFLASHAIPLPSLSEQRRIVGRIKEMLSHLEAIRQLRSQAEREGDLLLRSLRREYFGSPERVPEGWTEARLDEYADVIYGISAPIAKNKDPKIGTPIIRMANISIDGRLDLSDLRYQKIPTGRAEHFLLKKGDLLLNWRSGSAHHVGKTALFNGEGDYTCASFILRIRVKPQKANNCYLRHVLNFMRGEGLFKDSSRMQINSKLNARQFQEFPVRFPRSLQEQEVIAARLDAAESIVWARSEMLIGSVQQTSALSHAILGKAFAGEL